MNYKELQAEVKRLSELTGMPCPPLNGKKVVLEAALAELQAADAQDMANERGDVDVAADSIEFFTENEDEVVTTVYRKETPQMSVNNDLPGKAIDIYFEGINDSVNVPENLDSESVKSTPNTVAIALATTASDIIDVVVPVATKIVKATVGFAILSLISLAFVAWQHFSQYSKEVLIPKSALILREGIHRAFYYSQKAYAEVEQVKALVNGIPFVS